MKYALLYLGCKVNQAEIAEFERAIISAGHVIVGLDETPDVCIVNTCTVTARSDQESRQLIRRASETGARVLVTGCYADLNITETSRMQGVDKVVPNLQKPQIIKEIHQGISNISTPNTASQARSRTRFVLKVQDGCDFSCAYCLVWKARGKSRSITIAEAIERMHIAASEGYKEVVLSGVHLGLFGQDNNESLTGLLDAILKQTRGFRVRLSSLEVNEITPRLIELISDTRICPHLHIPLQSGDDSVLKSMRRNYTASEFSSRVQTVASAITNISIGTDVIAGFPSESATAFENTYNLISGLPLTYLHVFPYSTRPGTEAAALKDNVSDKVRKERASRLRELGALKKSAYINAQTGIDHEILVEESTDNNCWTGTTGNYLKAMICTGSDMKGRLVRIRVTGSENGFLVGNPLSIA